MRYFVKKKKRFTLFIVSELLYICIYFIYFIILFNYLFLCLSLFLDQLFRSKLIGLMYSKTRSTESSRLQFL